MSLGVCSCGFTCLKRRSQKKSSHGLWFETVTSCLPLPQPRIADPCRGLVRVTSWKSRVPEIRLPKSCEGGAE
jgi:hypothetical protein